MRRIAVVCAFALSLSLLSGCMPLIGVTVSSPKDEEFQREFQESWDEAMDDLARDLEDAQEDIRENFWNDWKSTDHFSGEKKHCWKVLDASGEELFTVTASEAVEALDDALSDGGWVQLTKDPGDPAYSYVFCQEKTLQAWQDPDGEREYEELVRFTVSASEDAVTMQILGGLEGMAPFAADLTELLTFSCSVPAEKAEVLRNPDQFSE